MVLFALEMLQYSYMEQAQVDMQERRRGLSIGPGMLVCLTGSSVGCMGCRWNGVDGDVVDGGLFAVACVVALQLHTHQCAGYTGHIPHATGMFASTCGAADSQTYRL